MTEGCPLTAQVPPGGRGDSRPAQQPNLRCPCLMGWVLLTRWISVLSLTGHSRCQAPAAFALAAGGGPTAGHRCLTRSCRRQPQQRTRQGTSGQRGGCLTVWRPEVGDRGVQVGSSRAAGGFGGQLFPDPSQPLMRLHLHLPLRVGHPRIQRGLLFPDHIRRDFLPDTVPRTGASVRAPA